MLVSHSELVSIIQEIKNFLYEVQKPVPFYLVENKFLNNKELPEDFDYFLFNIENLIFFQIKWNKEKKEYEIINKKKFLIAQDLLQKLFAEFLDFELSNKHIINISYTNHGNITKIVDYLKNHKLFRDYDLIDFQINIFKPFVRFLNSSKNYFYKIEKGKIANESLILISNSIHRLLPEIIHQIRKNQKINFDELYLIVDKLYNLQEKNIQKDELKNQLLKLKGRFIFDENNNIQLTDDIEYLNNYFQSNFLEWGYDIKIDETYLEMDLYILRLTSYSRGLFAVVFFGENFPLLEASEYIKTRPIIYIGNADGNSINLRELTTYLKPLISDNESINNWLIHNTKISLYEENISETLYKNILMKFSPVFNIKDNPGNLFSYTLEEKLKEYNNKIQL